MQKKRDAAEILYGDWERRTRAERGAENSLPSARKMLIEMVRRAEGAVTPPALASPRGLLPDGRLPLMDSESLQGQPVLNVKETNNQGRKNCCH